MLGEVVVLDVERKVSDEEVLAGRVGPVPEALSTGRALLSRLWCIGKVDVDGTAINFGASFVLQRGLGLISSLKFDIPESIS